MGYEINGSHAEQIVQIRRQFGYISQSSNLLKFLTAQQNIQMALELQSDLSPNVMYDRSISILASVGLGDHVDAYPDDLSGGQRQRVAIASALVHRPKLILADEPTASLDAVSGRNAVSLMQKLAKERGSAVLMVTHDNRILDLADQILAIEDGRLSTAISSSMLTQPFTQLQAA